MSYSTCVCVLFGHDFLKGLFTVTLSIRVFVVVITLPTSGPHIIITGLHFVTAPHHLFFINSKVEGTGFLNIIVKYCIFFSVNYSSVSQDELYICVLLN